MLLKNQRKSGEFMELKDNDIILEVENLVKHFTLKQTYSDSNSKILNLEGINSAISFQSFNFLKLLFMISIPCSVVHTGSFGIFIV